MKLRIIAGVLLMLVLTFGASSKSIAAPRRHCGNGGRFAAHLVVGILGGYYGGYYGYYRHPHYCARHYHYAHGCYGHHRCYR